MCWSFVKRKYSGRNLLKPYCRSVFNESSKAAVHVSKVCWKFTSWVKFYFELSLRIFRWKMRATPGTCIKPGSLTLRPLCHKVNLPASYEARLPLFHKVNLPLCEPRWRHFIMACDIFGTGQTNIFSSVFVIYSGKRDQPTVAPLTSLTQYTRPNYWMVHVSRTRIPLTFHWRLWWFPWNVWNWEV